MNKLIIFLFLLPFTAGAEILSPVTPDSSRFSILDTAEDITSDAQSGLYCEEDTFTEFDRCLVFDRISDDTAVTTYRSNSLGEQLFDLILADHGVWDAETVLVDDIWHFDDKRVVMKAPVTVKFFRRSNGKLAAVMHDPMNLRPVIMYHVVNGKRDM